MGKISGSHCLVLGCRNRQLLNQTNTRSYFRFPRDAELCKKWVDFCSRPELYKKYDENGPEYLYKSSRICSDHFQPTDFNNPNLFSQGLKKGSIPTVNPATHETKSNNGTGAGGALGATGGGGGGGSGSSNGAGSPIDEKLLSAVASIPNLSANLSLMVAAAVHAAQQSHQQQQQLLQANSGLNATNLKRSAAAMSGSGGSPAALQLTTASGTAPTTNSTTTTPNSGSSSAKRNRAVPPLATPTGALANLIQRHQQIKEQQRKAALGGSGGLVNGQVSITSVPGARTSPTTNSSAASRGGPISLVTSKKSAANNNNNNNNNNVSHHNHNHKANHEQKHDQSDFGLHMNDTDMTGGESSEGDSSYQNSADEDYAYHQKQKVAKVEAVIPPSLKSQLTVTPATINNNTIHSTNGGGSLAASPTNGTTINYKEKYEQTLKELFACRKIVKNQNKAIKQLQGEIDFLNQLLKEK